MSFVWKNAGRFLSLRRPQTTWSRTLLSSFLVEELTSGLDGVLPVIAMNLPPSHISYYGVGGDDGAADIMNPWGGGGSDDGGSTASGPGPAATYPTNAPPAASFHRHGPTAARSAAAASPPPDHTAGQNWHPGGAMGDWGCGGGFCDGGRGCAPGQRSATTTQAPGGEAHMLNRYNPNQSYSSAGVHYSQPTNQEARSLQHLPPSMQPSSAQQVLLPQLQQKPRQLPTLPPHHQHQQQHLSGHARQYKKLLHAQHLDQRYSPYGAGPSSNVSLGGTSETVRTSQNRVVTTGAFPYQYRSSKGGCGCITGSHSVNQHDAYGGTGASAASTGGLMYRQAAGSGLTVSAFFHSLGADPSRTPSPHRHPHSQKWEAHLWDPTVIRTDVAPGKRNQGRQIYLGAFRSEFPLQDYAEMESFPPLDKEVLVDMLKDQRLRGEHRYQRFTRQRPMGHWEAFISKMCSSPNRAGLPAGPLDLAARGGGAEAERLQHGASGSNSHAHGRDRSGICFSGGADRMAASAGCGTGAADRLCMSVDPAAAAAAAAAMEIAAADVVGAGTCTCTGTGTRDVTESVVRLSSRSMASLYDAALFGRNNSVGTAGMTSSSVRPPARQAVAAAASAAAAPAVSAPPQAAGLRSVVKSLEHLPSSLSGFATEGWSLVCVTLPIDPLSSRPIGRWRVLVLEHFDQSLFVERGKGL
ncbi:hypothetical protein VOLCADRAFT_92644 [Volvox carteri f. nagariensis]|uniref:Uncharacterized protein n=1 Tax=Volvox carteri f. nagariensis TaxID=3068 RepID=D8U068_VOLCA|nr:uncharacterized protein VOLCADRAFT_92644 [Volvox carteri f. nagariensis]EFJ46811.1 hypothetical protein VOLCADRAFT_92644 [Volvox carteri f. nagariensis]|eukprot:XP_002952020.1 hypothetical protein VOLCADRAFT_92644 [Volvox carteri f. nagariensis]